MESKGYDLGTATKIIELNSGLEVTSIQFEDGSGVNFNVTFAGSNISYFTRLPKILGLEFSSVYESNVNKPTFKNIRD